MSSEHLRATSKPHQPEDQIEIQEKSAVGKELERLPEIAADTHRAVLLAPSQEEFLKAVQDFNSLSIVERKLTYNPNEPLEAQRKFPVNGNFSTPKGYSFSVSVDANGVVSLATELG
jgi:hypothetical protein